MIIDWCLDIVGSLIDWLVSMLPAWSFHIPPGMADMISSLKAWDDILPMSELLTCVTSCVSLFAAMTTYKLIVKLIDLIAAVIP